MVKEKWGNPLIAKIETEEGSKGERGGNAADWILMDEKWNTFAKFVWQFVCVGVKIMEMRVSVVKIQKWFVERWVCMRECKAVSMYFLLLLRIKFKDFALCNHILHHTTAHIFWSTTTFIHYFHAKKVPLRTATKQPHQHDQHHHSQPMT